MEQMPRIGVGVTVIKNGKVLLLKRTNAHGEGTWCYPGGHLEFGESVFDCARRETDEETGVQITNIRKEFYTEDSFEAENKHYITLFITADWRANDPEIREPHKCTELEWFSWDSLPTPLFLPIENAIRQGYSPFS